MAYNNNKTVAKVDMDTKNRIARFVPGTKYTIGSFYDEAANEKLDKLEKKSKKGLKSST